MVLVKVMAYHDKHKQFLQFFMQERIVSEHTAKKMNDVLFSEKTIDNTIEIINTKIVPLEFKINKTVCEQNGNIDYVFVSMCVDEFKAKQDQAKIMFKLLVDCIMLSGGSIPYYQAIRFNEQMSDAMLNTFFSNKYLVADNDNNIFLSPVAISELEGYLAEKFKEKRCMGCKSIVSYGIKCPSCEKFVHGHCLTDYFKNTKSKKCPNCSKQISLEWNIVDVNNQL